MREPTNWRSACAARLANWTGQLYALRCRIKPGDLMVLPLKTTSQIAFGRVTEGYRYLADNDPGKRHVIPVQWLRTDLPRSVEIIPTDGAALRQALEAEKSV